MDFAKAFTFMFEDPDWLKKLGIGTLIGLLGIVLSPVLVGIVPLLVLLGYTIDVLRNVMHGSDRPLPEWDNWGSFLAKGFKVAAASFVWSLPAILLTVPLVVGSMMADQGGSAGNLGGAEALGIGIILCGTCLMILWSLFVTLISPAIYVRIAETDRFSSAFNFGAMWAFTRDNIGNIILALLLMIVVGFIASIVAGLGFVALVIGVLITLPFATLWQYLVQAHLFGQIGRFSVTPVD